MSTVAMPTNASYPFRAAMLLSQSREVVRQWGMYELRASLMENSECLLTIGQREQEPHINEVFPNGEACLHYLREHDLPGNGWCPVELMQAPTLLP